MTLLRKLQHGQHNTDGSSHHDKTSNRSEIPDAEAVMSTTFITVRRGELNLPARMLRPLDLAPTDRHAYLATTTPTQSFSPRSQ